MIRRLINHTVSLMKGERFELDPQIPLGYLLSFFLNKGWMCICGMWKLRTMKRVFVHYSSTIKCRSRIYSMQNLSIDRGCYIDALSSEGISFGYNVSIGKYTTIECTGTLKSLGKGLKVGSRVGLGTHGFFGCAGGIEIGDDTIFGNYVSLHSENHNFQDRNIPIRLQGVKRKGIIIGKQGKKLKGVGKAARLEIEALLGTKVFLELWVKVKENWRDSDLALSNFGYRDE